MMQLRWLFLLTSSGLAGLALGCESAAECGPGTVEVAGVCAATEGPQGPPMCCGPGTHYDVNQLTCAPNFPARVCDVASTIEEVGIDGVIVCVGYGEQGCALGCPQPDPGKVTVCGTLLDVASSAPIEVAGATGARCESASQGGPCALELNFYDALEFSQNPTGAAPLPYDELVVNECGSFMASNIPVPALGFLGIGVDDAAAAVDEHVLSGVAMAAAPGQRISAMNTYVVQRSSDQLWTTTAANPFGVTTFNQRGAVLIIYQDCAGNPAAGVQISSDSSTRPADDYYFSDVDPLARTTVAPALVATGANGSALLVNSALVDHGGEGGAPPGCYWPSALAKSIPGVTFITERHPEDDGSGSCCAE